MANQDPAAVILKDTSGNYVKGRFTIVNPQDKYSIDTITQDQIGAFGQGNVPGVKVRVELNIEAGAPGDTFTHTFDVGNGLVLNDRDKQFMDIGVYVWDDTTSKFKRKGGGIVRTSDSVDI